MTACKVLLEAVETAIKNNLPLGITDKEVSILPEGKVPASMGERHITIHPIALEGRNPAKQSRPRNYIFEVSVTSRMRKDPNDRFQEEAYIKEDSMANVMEELIGLVESNYMYTVFKTALDLIPIEPRYVDPPYDLDNIPIGLPSRYSVTGSFVFNSQNLDPKHLYPSDFLTRSGNDKEQLYDKIAGYQLSARFTSPSLYRTYNGIECKPLYVSS